MTALLPLLEACIPRPKEQTSEEYAADLHKALGGEIRTAAKAADFFTGTYATPAMRRVTTGIFDRLRHGRAAGQPAFIRFDSAFGGGKTHTLIALAATARHPELVRGGVAGGLLPPELAVDDVQLVCFTGENSDILHGMAMEGTDRRPPKNRGCATAPTRAAEIRQPPAPDNPSVGAILSGQRRPAPVAALIAPEIPLRNPNRAAPALSGRHSRRKPRCPGSCRVQYRRRSTPEARRMPPGPSGPPLAGKRKWYPWRDSNPRRAT